jgi:hypothetical protein
MIASRQGRCQQCGRPVPGAVYGVVARYCSPGCRQAAHRERQRQERQ